MVCICMHVRVLLHEQNNQGKQKPTISRELSSSREGECVLVRVLQQARSSTSHSRDAIKKSIVLSNVREEKENYEKGDGVRISLKKGG